MKHDDAGMGRERLACGNAARLPCQHNHTNTESIDSQDLRGVHASSVGCERILVKVRF